MTVEIELYGQFGERFEPIQSLELETSVSVRGVVIILGLEPEEVGLVTIDGVQQWMDDAVPLACRLCFFPPMSGG